LKIFQKLRAIKKACQYIKKTETASEKAKRRERGEYRILACCCL